MSKTMPYSHMLEATLSRLIKIIKITCAPVETARKANCVACCTPALPAIKTDDHRTTKVKDRNKFIIGIGEPVTSNCV